MSYKKAVLYFMSGTGNSYRVASWLNEKLITNDTDSAVRTIDRDNEAEKLTGGVESLIGIIMPTHGFTAPWHVIRFALSMPSANGAHALVVPTRGGLKIGPVFLPGMQGTAGYLIALILILKGYCIRGIIGVDMPSNWTALHSGLNLVNSNAIINRAKIKVEKFIQKILSEGQCFGGLFELVLGILLLPISVGYLLIGRYGLAMSLFASNSCSSCGLCSRSCPVGAIKMLRGKPSWNYKCESCMRCMNFCPSRSIEASHLLILASFLMIPATICIFNYLLAFMSGTNSIIAFLIKTVIYSILVILEYMVFLLLNRSPFISRFFALTTPTFYYRRYREPGTKLTDLTKK